MSDMAEWQGMDVEWKRLRRIEAEAQTVADRWDDYVEAHAGRGHDGPHEPQPLLEGDCGPCAAAQYGTEVEMGEYAIPALRAALSVPEPARRKAQAEEGRR